MSSDTQNNMSIPREADEECISSFRDVKEAILNEIKRINKDDFIHGLHEMDKLKHITEFTPVLYATERVAYGLNYFAKIHLGDEKYIHARAFRGDDDNKVTFHSLLTTPECAVWEKDTPLTYFTD
ncbi:hypothetical protein BGZ74_008405 [Mortierella antarctica]|nr:hypothetical protein BGZ74_008405 [Mortierella antarctica]KAG0355137.1 hypothetical protein BG005_005934 [Podila minutissima]